MTFSRIDNIASSILIVERDPLMLTAIGSVMNMQGHTAVLARTEEVAMASIARTQFDVIVFSIDDLDEGCLFASRLRSMPGTQDVPLIFLVPQHTGSWNERLAEQGGVFSMLKSGDPHVLIELVEKLLWMPHIAKGRVATPNVLQSRQVDWVKLTDS